MKIIYYGHDGSAAKAMAADIRRSKGGAQVRHAMMFTEPEKCDGIVLMPDVEAHDADRINAAYGVDAPVKAIVEPGDDALTMTDDELREAIKAATGKAPHGKAKRETLEARWRGINNGS